MTRRQPGSKFLTSGVLHKSFHADMAAERETLLEKAHPAAQAFCQKHSLMLEVKHFSPVYPCPKATTICDGGKASEMVIGFSSLQKPPRSQILLY